MQGIDEPTAAYFEFAVLGKKYDLLRYILRHQSHARAGKSSRLEYMSRDVCAIGSMDNSLRAAIPDHVHVLISPLADRDASISGFAKWFKRWV